MHRLPPPKGDGEAPLKALLVDSWYDAYLGVVVLVRVVDGVLQEGPGDPHDAHRRAPRRSTASASSRPRWWTSASSGPGEIGFLTGSIKEVADTRVGDTITDDRRRAAEPLPGFRPAQPVVFCGLFPVDAADFENLRAAMGKLRLNDASFSYEMETSRRARLRLPLRLSGPAAPGDHPGAADARVRPRPDRHRPLGHLPDPPDRRHGAGAAQPGRHAGPGANRGDPRAVDPRHDPHARRASRRDPKALPGPARHPGRPLLCRQPRHGAVRPAAQRGGLRLLRPAEVGLQGLRLASTTTSPATARATSSRCRSWSTPSRSTRSPCWCTAARRRRRGRAHGGEAQGADPAASFQDPASRRRSAARSSPARRSRRSART